MIATIVAAASVGLASSFHCAAMCGPVAFASCSRDAAFDSGRTATYALSRLAGYSLVGAIVGALAAPWTGSVPVRLAAAAITAIVIGRAGVRLLRRERDRTIVPLRRKPRFSPALLGFATALFPCGALLSGVVVASGSGSALAGALSMAAFAVASTPGLLSAAIGATSIARQFAHARTLAGVVLLAVAALTVGQAAMFARAKPHACCAQRAG